MFHKEEKESKVQAQHSVTVCFTPGNLPKIYYKIIAIWSDEAQRNPPVNHQQHSRLLLLASFNRVWSRKIRSFITMQRRHFTAHYGILINFSFRWVFLRMAFREQGKQIWLKINVIKPWVCIEQTTNRPLPPKAVLCFLLTAYPSHHGCWRDQNCRNLGRPLWLCNSYPVYILWKKHGNHVFFSCLNIIMKHFKGYKTKEQKD